MARIAVAIAAVTVVVAQVPSGPPTWQMNRSTIIMPCNNTGFTDPKSTAGFGVVDFE